MVKKNKKSIHVVIVGGGFAGVKAALELANKKGVSVTLISKTTNFEYHGALYRSATGRSPLEVVMPLREIFARATNVEIVLDSIAAINSKSNIVKSETGNVYSYDALFLALGNTVNYFGLPGAEGHSFTIDSIASTIALRHELTKLFKQPKSQPTIAIVGAGASGVELAGAIPEFARAVAHKYRIAQSRPKVVLLEGTDRVLPNLDPILSAKAYKRLKKLGVEMHFNTRVNTCEPNKVCLSSGDIDAEIIIWTAGNKLPEFYSHNTNEFVFERGRVKVDAYLRAWRHTNIFVLGDNACTPYSGMAQTAIRDATFVARNLLRVQAAKHAVAYRAFRPIYSVPIGDKWAIFQSPKHYLSGYRAWLLRRRADLWVIKNFYPMKKAKKIWRKAYKASAF